MSRSRAANVSAIVSLLLGGVLAMWEIYNVTSS